jgi:macrolide-specific efflux system membrane fusion protein
VDGVITEVNGNVGEISKTTEPTVVMIPNSRLQIDVNLSEDNVANVKVGQSVRITLDAFPNMSWQGTVDKVDPAQTVIGGAIYYKTTVAFDQPDDRIRTGMTANVWIQTGSSQSSLVVPQSAITWSSSGPQVQIYRGGMPQVMLVTTGLTDERGMVEILSGVSEGDEVVVGTQ